MKPLPLLLLLPILLSACTTISGTPGAGLASTPAGVQLTADLKGASYNLDQAVAVGALSPTDQAPACLTAVMTQLGVLGPPPLSFTPQVNGPISAGSVAYILAQQALALKNGAGGDISVPCEAMVGKLVIDAGRLGLQIGAGHQPTLVETADEALLRKARGMAYSLGITVYIRDGSIHQRGPLPGDITIEPPPNAKPEIAARGPIEGS